GIPTLYTPGSGQFLTTDDFQTPCMLPKFQPTPVIDIPGEVKNFLEVVQVESLVEINNVESAEGVARYRIPLNVQDAMDGQIMALRVDPGIDGPMQSTLLGVFTRYYAQWSGSLDFTFMFCGTFMTTGKVIIAYTPPGGDQPTNRRQAMLGTHVVWDFGLQSSITLVVPWISSGHFRGTTLENTIYKYRYYEAGYITMWYQTNMVVPPNFPTTASILMFVAAQPNFSLRILKDRPDISQEGALQ
uniref:Capsid protein n=1 Tax=Enterovirus E TaxID=12064 RepID=UPI000B4966CE|nr:Chain C, Capsid protein [Enterovirus E]6T40_C Chain C, VP3 [Enterovirus F]6T48_C Chain C, VP3 [Enterovirus F]6T4C_C Chain C, VP3 [Enterovirus F]